VRSKIFTPGLSDPLANLNAVDFYTEARLIDVAAAQDGDAYDTLRSLTLAVYRDGALVTFDDPKTLGVQNSKLGRLIGAARQLPLFAVYEYFNENEGFWGRDALSLGESAKRAKFTRIAPGSRLLIYTTNYLRDLLNETGGEEAASDAEAQLGGLLAGGLQPGVDGMDQADALLTPIKNGASEEISAVKLSQPNVKFISPRRATSPGRLRRRATTHIWGRLRWRNCSQRRGGLTDNADLTRIEVVKQKIQSRIVSGKIRRVNLSKTEARDCALLIATA
jgi:hypothetical protein